MSLRPSVVSSLAGDRVAVAVLSNLTFPGLRLAARLDMWLKYFKKIDTSEVPISGDHAGAPPKTLNTSSVGVSKNCQ